MGIFLGIRYYSTRAARWLDSACALSEAQVRPAPSFGIAGEVNQPCWKSVALAEG